MQFDLQEKPPQEEIEEHLDAIVEVVVAEPTPNRITNLRILLGILLRHDYDVQSYIEIYNGLRIQYNDMFEKIH